MKTKAAVLYGIHEGGLDLVKNNVFKVEELDLDEPKEGEVLVKVMGSGICHSDHHCVDGMYTVPYPIVVGHEAGVRVEKLGPGCKKLKEGDHAIASWMPACGKCDFCVSGRQPLCVRGADLMNGCMPDKTFRLHKGKTDVGQLHFVGSFTEYAIMLEDSLTVIDKKYPLEVVGITGCAVPTGVGAAINAAKVEPGSTCVVVGCGGIGTSIIQGCRIAGATRIIAVDHNDEKLKLMKQFGATHTFNNEKEDVLTAIKDLTWGKGCDYGFEAIATPGTQELAFNCTRNGGLTTFVGLMWNSIKKMECSPFDLTLCSKTIKGTLYGDSNMSTDIPRLLKMYESGQLLLDEMVTRTYTLDNINQGFDDMLNGKNVRGMIKMC